MSQSKAEIERGRWDRPAGELSAGVSASALTPRLPYCHSRRDFDAEKGVFFCAHPKMHVERGLVTAEICRLCSFWRERPPERHRPYIAVSGAERHGPCMFLGKHIGLRECAGCRGNVQIKVFACGHPHHDETTLHNCSTCVDFEDRLEVGGIESWMVGVTTAPRRQPTLERCLTSLKRAGWDDVQLFAEPGVTVPASARTARVTWRESTLGAWPNWYLGLAELYLRDPWADAYFMIQDDTVFCCNLRQFLEQALWPAARTGIVSAYCPAPYSTGERGLHEVSSSGGIFGALTYIFPNAAVRLLLSHPDTIAHRLRGEPDGRRLTDVVVGEWASKLQMPVYYHSPSLAQHIGETTTIWGYAPNSGQRHSCDFVGEDFDALSLLPD